MAEDKLTILLETKLKGLENIDMLNKKMDMMNVRLGKAGDVIDKTSGRSLKHTEILDRQTRATNRLQKMQDKARRRFDMNTLSWLFGGMALQRLGMSMVRFIIPSVKELGELNSVGAKKALGAAAAFQFLKVSLFETLAATPGFQKFVEWIVKGAIWISEFVQEHPKILEMAVAVGAVAAALGTLAMGAGIFMQTSHLIRLFGDLLKSALSVSAAMVGLKIPSLPGPGTPTTTVPTGTAAKTATKTVSQKASKTAAETAAKTGGRGVGSLFGELAAWLGLNKLVDKIGKSKVFTKIKDVFKRSGKTIGDFANRAGRGGKAGKVGSKIGDAYIALEDFVQGGGMGRVARGAGKVLGKVGRVAGPISTIIGLAEIDIESIKTVSKGFGNMRINPPDLKFRDYSNLPASSQKTFESMGSLGENTGKAAESMGLLDDNMRKIAEERGNNFVIALMSSKKAIEEVDDSLVKHSLVPSMELLGKQLLITNTQLSIMHTTLVDVKASIDAIPDETHKYVYVHTVHTDESNDNPIFSGIKGAISRGRDLLSSVT